MLAILSGCISQQPEVLKVNPEIDLATPVGFYNKSEGMFTIIKGSIPEVKESLREAPQQSTFSVNDSLNIIVFREVFSKAGYDINIDRVERQGNAFTVYATYTDWRADVPVETYPTEIIPIGKLGAGNYEIRLKVTKVMEDINETKVIEGKATETEKELVVFNFKVKPPEDKKVILEVNPVIGFGPLDGFYGKPEGMFTIINGSIPEVNENLKNIVIKKATQQYTFSTDDDLNFVVFRGVQKSGGYIININKVEMQGNTFTVYATYTDPGKGIFVTGALTYPGAIIPIGRLAAGDYKAVLKVTKVLNTIEGEKVIETEKESDVFNFEMKK